MSQSLKKKLVVGTAWSITGQIGYVLISLGTNIILARVLGPQVFGQIGIIMFFILIANVLTESGLSGALVRKQNITEEDYSTVFIFNLVISILLFLLFVFTSDTISDFYKDSSLKNILIVTSLVLIINAFKIVNNARLIHSLNYKKRSIIALIAVTIASIIGIIMATIFKTGIWAIVAVQLITALLITIQLWFHFGFLRKLVFCKKSFISLYRFGINTTLASLLNTAFDNVYQLVLGKFYSMNQTGLFFQAKRLQGVPVGVIQSTSLGIVFATLSKVQDDLELFGKLYNRIITAFTVAIGFICLFIYFYAEEIILLLYGQEWIGAVFYVQILIVASFFYMQEMFNRIIFKVFDRTEKILYLEIAKKTFQALTILIGILMKRIDILLYGFLLTSIISYFLNYYHSRKVFGGFSWFEIIMVLKVLFIGTFIVFVGTLLKTNLPLNGFTSFILLPVFVLVYISLINWAEVSNVIKEVKYLKSLIINKDVK